VPDTFKTSSLVVLPRILLYCYRPVTVASMYAHAIAQIVAGGIKEILDSGSQTNIPKIAVRDLHTISTSLIGCFPVLQA
jgi:hypothetical protein